MTAREIFSKTLSYEIEKQNININDLAKNIGITPQTVRRYMKGETAPLGTGLVLISDYLNVTTDYLLGLKDKKGNKLQHSPNREKCHDNAEQ